MPHPGQPAYEDLAARNAELAAVVAEQAALIGALRAKVAAPRRHIPPAALTVTEYRTMSRSCGCGQVTAAPPPGVTGGRVCYGPNVVAAATLLASTDVIGIERVFNPFDLHQAGGLAGRAEGRHRSAAGHRPARAPQSTARRGPRAGGVHRHRLPRPGRRRRAGCRRRAHGHAALLWVHDRAGGLWHGACFSAVCGMRRAALRRTVAVVPRRRSGRLFRLHGSRSGCGRLFRPSCAARGRTPPETP